MARTALGCSVCACLVVVLAAIPGSAFANERSSGAADPGATGLMPCASLSGVLCRSISVPLDPAGASPRTVRLFVTVRRPSGPRPPRGTILFLAGGPGQAATQLFDLRSTLWSRLFPGYTLVAYDNRGTGQSGPLTCRRGRTAARCARAIGPNRVFYGTRDNVADVESVREALGVERLALFGLSYGTKQALAYALAHPEHVERLLLDSVVLPNGPDPFGITSLRAIPAALASICHRGACASVTKRPAADFARLANRLDAHPVVANVPVYTTHWTPIRRHIRIDGAALLSLATASDLNSGIAVELPAAVEQALEGRPELLEHLAALVSQQDSSDVNDAVFYATTCGDGPFPWAPETRVARRETVLTDAIAALPRRSLGRFGSWAVGGPTRQCLGWPAPAGSRPVSVDGLPDVPVLVLAGDRDVRTPLREGTAAAALFPNGRVLLAPGVGHTVVGSSACVQNAVRTWIGGGTPAASCPRVPLTIRPIGVLPATVSSAKPVGRIGGLVGSTLGATIATIREAEASWFVQYPAGWVVGLKGGLVDGEDFDVFRFSAYSDVPGLAVSGRVTFAVSKLGTLVPDSETGIVEVGGRSAASGFLQIRGRRIFGLVGGHRVSTRF